MTQRCWIQIGCAMATATVRRVERWNWSNGNQLNHLKAKAEMIAETTAKQSDRQTEKDAITNYNGRINVNGSYSNTISNLQKTRIFLFQFLLQSLPISGVIIMRIGVDKEFPFQIEDTINLLPWQSRCCAEIHPAVHLPHRSYTAAASHVNLVSICLGVSGGLRIGC